MSIDNERIVTEFCNSWLHGTDGFDRYVADDLYYLNVPLEPIRGRDAARAFLGQFIGAEHNLLERMDIPHTASAGDVVMNERLEIWKKDDLRVELPVMGTFELRDGKIVSWRDYFDLATLQPLIDAVLGG